jgi:tRNA (cytidine/uridine-2'-O-)-methyltransferase
MTPATQTADPVDVERHVVLVAPDVHWNTGNVGRTCLGTDTSLHLIRPLGFSLNAREVKRAGLDYWHKIKLTIWDSFPDFMEGMGPKQGEVAVFSKTGKIPFWHLPARDRLFLVFGSETKGLPAFILSMFKDNLYHIPTTASIRSLNLSTSVGIVLYESLRSYGPSHSWIK